jgi:hypothetical protein
MSMRQEVVTVPRVLLEDIRDIVLAHGLAECRDPERAQRLNRLWQEVRQALGEKF